MRVDVTFRNLGATAPLKGYAADKVSRLSRYLIRPIDGQITLEKDGFRHVVEASVRDAGAVLTAKEVSQKDMYAAIDLVVDKLKAQALRRKGKVTQHAAEPTSDLLARKEADVWQRHHADLDAELDALGE